MTYTQWFVEETAGKDENGPIYRIVFEGTSEDCIKYLETVTGKNRLEVWSQAWADTSFGYAPLAWKN